MNLLVAALTPGPQSPKKLYTPSHSHTGNKPAAKNVAFIPYSGATLNNHTNAEYNDVDKNGIFSGYPFSEDA